MQVSSALGGILLLILLAGWLFRRLGFARRRATTSCSTCAPVAVGQRERVVVEVDDTLLVLGVTAQQITLLHTLPAPPKDEGAADAATPADFRQLMQKF